MNDLEGILLPSNTISIGFSIEEQLDTKQVDNMYILLRDIIQNHKDCPFD